MKKILAATAAVVLGALAFVMPSVRRYLKIERM
jgi:Family of unknown function (DUF6893)